MKITMKQAFKFNTLFEKISNKVLNINFTYKLAKGMSKIKNEIEFYQDEYNKYLNLFIQKDENGNFISDGNQGYKIIKGKEQECKEKIKELDNFSFELNDFCFELEELKELELTVEEMIIFLPFIKDKNEDK